METKQISNIKIYRDGELSRWETAKPRIHANMVTFGNWLDQVFIQQTFRPELEQLSSRGE
jgi:hypothetical protein